MAAYPPSLPPLPKIPKDLTVNQAEEWNREFQRIYQQSRGDSFMRVLDDFSGTAVAFDSWKHSIEKQGFKNTHDIFGIFVYVLGVNKEYCQTFIIPDNSIDPKDIKKGVRLLNELGRNTFHSSASDKQLYKTLWYTETGALTYTCELRTLQNRWNEIVDRKYMWVYTPPEEKEKDVTPEETPVLNPPNVMILQELKSIIDDPSKRMTLDRKKDFFIALGFDKQDLNKLSDDRITKNYDRIINPLPYPMMNSFKTRGIDNPSKKAFALLQVWKDFNNGKLTGTPAVPEVPAQTAGGEDPRVKAIMDILNTPSGGGGLTEGQVIDLIKKHTIVKPTEIKIIKGKEVDEKEIGKHHKRLPDIMKMLSARDYSGRPFNIMLVGPAGSGKTTLAEQCAKALDVSFYFNGAISSEYKLTGFIDAQGKIVSTAFREAYEKGGLYLFDEMDASLPDALLAFNAALSNGHYDFPDGTVQRHKDFYCMAATNTFGKGADRVYVGRSQLDAASLDRFLMVNLDYDQDLELALARNEQWTRKVQKIRHNIEQLKIRHVVSPRASMAGAAMLAAGFREDKVLDMVVWKGLDKDSVSKIKKQGI